MKTLVLLPNYNRPEMLQITLELITKTPNYQERMYLFSLDVGYRANMLDPLIADWRKHFKYSDVYKVPVMPTSYRQGMKQSYAVVQGYRAALSYNPDYVFMIEDDIAVANTFFDWHMRVQQAVQPFVSIGTRNHVLMPPIPDTTESGKYYIHSSYESLGVCWQSENLERMTHEFTPSYFQAPDRFLATNYPKSDLPLWQLEQDGHIQRYIREHKLPVVWAYLPCSYHFGIYGKSDRTKRVTGTLDEKVAKLRQIVFSPVTMQEHYQKENCPDYYFQDSLPIPLQQTMGETIQIPVPPSNLHSP